MKVALTMKVLDQAAMLSRGSEGSDQVAEQQREAQGTWAPPDGVVDDIPELTDENTESLLVQEAQNQVLLDEQPSSSTAGWTSSGAKGHKIWLWFSRASQSTVAPEEARDEQPMEPEAGKPKTFAPGQDKKESPEQDKKKEFPRPMDFERAPRPKLVNAKLNQCLNESEQGLSECFLKYQKVLENTIQQAVLTTDKSTIQTEVESRGRKVLGEFIQGACDIVEAERGGGATAAAENTAVSREAVEGLQTPPETPQLSQQQKDEIRELAEKDYVTTMTQTAFRRWCKDMLKRFPPDTLQHASGERRSRFMKMLFEMIQMISHGAAIGKKVELEKENPAMIATGVKTRQLNDAADMQSILKSMKQAVAEFPENLGVNGEDVMTRHYGVVLDEL